MPSDPRELTQEENSEIQAAWSTAHNSIAKTDPMDMAGQGFELGFLAARASSPAPDAAGLEKQISTKLMNLLSREHGFVNDPIGRREVVALVLAAVASSPVPEGSKQALDVEVGDCTPINGGWKIVGRRVGRSGRVTLTAESLDGEWSSTRTFDPGSLLPISPAAPVPSRRNEKRAPDPGRPAAHDCAVVAARATSDRRYERG